MIRCLLALALVAASVRADDKKDAPKLDGTWTATLWQRGPGVVGADKVDTELVIKGNAFEYPKGINRVAPKGTFKADAAQGTIDFTPDAGPAKGKTLPGIYKIEGNVLTICFTAAGGERPKAFKSTDRMTVLATYERKKEKR